MSATRNNRTVVTGSRLAPRKPVPASRSRRFLNPDTAADQGWRKQAECLEYDAELWFADGPAAKEDAAAICDVCPVREKCLTWATETRQSYGIWGGEDFGADIKPWHAKRKKESKHDGPDSADPGTGGTPEVDAAPDDGSRPGA